MITQTFTSDKLIFCGFRWCFYNTKIAISIGDILYDVLAITFSCRKRMLVQCRP